LKEGEEDVVDEVVSLGVGVETKGIGGVL